MDVYVARESSGQVLLSNGTDKLQQGGPRRTHPALSYSGARGHLARGETDGPGVSDHYTPGLYKSAPTARMRPSVYVP